MKIERVGISQLCLDPSNARIHPDDNLEAIGASLKRFGQVEPLVVQQSSGRVIGGNGRLAVMKSLGWTECDVVELDIDDLTATALGIALNRSGSLSSWEPETLAKLLDQLRTEDALDGVGFDSADIDALLDDLQLEAELGDATDETPTPAPPDDPVTRAGDIWVLGDHRLMCGDSASPEDLDRLLDGNRIQLVNTDPPYNVKVEPRSNNAIAAGMSSFGGTHHQKFDAARHPSKAKHADAKLRAKDRPLQNDFMKPEDFEALLDRWFGNIGRVLEPGRAFYVWGGYANVPNYPRPLAENELYFSQAIIWVKEHPVLTRKDYMGNHEWCQPAGTRVLTPEGEVPIESLRTGDRVVSMRKRDYRLVGTKRGSAITATSRPYSGDLLGVVAHDKTTWCTPGHLWSVRLTDDADRLWCTYLMRRGDWWRVGKARLITTWGFGLKHRLYTEDADEAWVLNTYGSSLEAAIDEQVMLAQYGIPTFTWSESHHHKGLRQIDDVRRVYDRLDLDAMRESAQRLLTDHGRQIDCPLLRSERDRVKISRRVTCLVRACNLLPGAMEVPRPDTKEHAVRWERIRAVDRQQFEGPVYSMDVDKWHHYIADGLVTHNCFYGWRSGSAHQYYGPKNATDVWSIKKVNPASMVHLTEKPVELASRAMLYSSKRGENVLDLFGGSGSTLMGAQETGRRAFLMEIDPPYCDVIVNRWQRATGKTATLDGDGRTFDEITAERIPEGADDGATGDE